MYMATYSQSENKISKFRFEKEFTLANIKEFVELGLAKKLPQYFES
jgi:hypothetical protein